MPWGPEEKYRKWNGSTGVTAERYSTLRHRGRRLRPDHEGPVASNLPPIFSGEPPRRYEATFGFSLVERERGVTIFFDRNAAE